MLIMYNKKNIFIVNLKFYLKKNIKFFYILLFIIAYLLHILSLEKCYEGFDLCSLKTKWIERKISEAVVSCLIIVILIESIFYKYISSLNFLHLLLFYFSLYIYSHGIDFEDHGYYNFFGNITIIIVLLLIISPLNFLLYLIRLNNKLYIHIYFNLNFIDVNLFLCFSILY